MSKRASKELPLQGTFQHEFHRVIVNTLFTANWIRDLQDSVFRPHGFSPQHFNILRIALGRDPEPVTPSQLKASMIDRSPDITRLVDKLYQLRLVNRDTCRGNRRQVCITLTEKGKNIVMQMEKDLFSQLDEMRGKLTDKEAKTLNLLLDKIRR
jgi:DNA-binding MarR family transcriptional regulator